MVESSAGLDESVHNNSMTFCGVSYINDGVSPGSPAASFSGLSTSYAEVTLSNLIDVTSMSWIMQIYRSGQGQGQLSFLLPSFEIVIIMVRYP